MTFEISRYHSHVAIALLAILAVLLGAPTAAQPDHPRHRMGAKPLSLADTPLFVLAEAYDSGGYIANALAIADLNRDGKLDVIVGNTYTVGLLLGNNDGTFQPVQTLDSGGMGAAGVAIADLNSDGKLDVVLAFGNVRVLLGNGDGTFQPPVAYGTGERGGWSVAVGDFNNDHKLDLVATNISDGSVGVLLGNGDGTFQTAVVYGSGGTDVWGVTVADVNKDGKPDILTANFSGTIGVLLGNGDGTFQPAVGYNSARQYPEPQWVVVSDVNNDGKLDLLAANGDGTLGVLLGNGDGTFQAANTYDGGAVRNYSVAVTDVNRDGKPDALLANAGGGYGWDGSVGVLLGNGDGTFQAVLDYDSGGFPARSLAVADLNADGRPDVVAANYCSYFYEGTGDCKTNGSIGVLLNNLGPHAATTTSLDSSPNPVLPLQTVTYTAIVSSESGGTMSGTVLFQDGISPIARVAVQNNQGIYQTSYKKSGTHAISAVYSGDLHNSGSTSRTITQYVGRAPFVTKTLISTSGSPTYIGQPVTFTATVAPADPKFGAIPDGELVTFHDAKMTLASVPLSNGAAWFVTSSLSARKHAIKATYPGDGIFKLGSAMVTQIVQLYPTTTTLTSSLNPSQFGKLVTFTATVTSPGPMPTGNVKFWDGTTALGTASLDGGVARLNRSKLTVGTHPITAQYLGDVATAKSMSPVVNQVVQ